MHKKCILVFLAVFLLFILLASALSHFVILPPFVALEQQELSNNLDRSQAALDADAEDLLRLTGDWAEWDDSYGFIQNRNQTFIDDNLPWDYLKGELSLDTLLIINTAKQPVWGEAMDDSPHSSASADALAAVLTQDVIFQAALGGDHISGVMPVAGRLWLLAVRDVVRSSGEGPANGILVMGKLVSPAYFQKLSQRTKIDFSLEILPEKIPSASSFEPKEQGAESSGQIIDQYSIRASREINDLQGVPSALLTLKLPRVIYQQGLNAALAASVALSVVGLLLALVCSILVSRNQRLTAMRTELGESLAAKTAALQAYERSEAERAELDQKLRQKYKMEAIGTMAGGIAHDFNNILAIIIGNANLMQNKLPADSRCHKNLTNLLVASTRAGDLVKQILTYSRLKKPLLLPCDLTAILNESTNLLRSTASSAVEISPAFETNKRIWINADATQIQQILINLCSNAVHAMSGQGRLGLSLKERTLMAGDLPAPHQFLSGRFAQLSISDTGCGMSAELLERIFDPFFTTKGPAEGTGMGLSVVQGIVDNHNGIIDIETVEGEGSTFHIFFHLGQPTVTRDAEVQPPSPRGNEHILFVDDEKMLISSSVEILEHLGYQVSAESSSRKALELFSNNPSQFDMLITDMTMPELSGLELAREIRTFDALIPIILCSGYYSGGNQQGTADQAINAFCSKPLDLHQLALTIRRVLDA